MDLSDSRAFGGAILATLGLLVLVRLAYIGIYEPRNLTRPAYILRGLVMAHPPGGAPLPSEPVPNWTAALARADLQAGQQLSRQCIACHDLSPAMQNGLGPALRGIVGRTRASLAGYAYSPAMLTEHGAWTPNALFEFLRDPQLAVPGTKMTFGGLADAQQRIDLIAYLRSGGD